MDLVVNRTKLFAALTLAKRKRSTLPILNGINLNAHEGQVTLSTTDLMISLSVDLSAEIEASGGVVVDAAALHNLVKKLKASTLRLRASAKGLSVLVEGAEFKLMGTAQSGFPELPDPSGLSFTRAMGHALADLIQKTQFSVSTDEARDNFNGVLFECDGEMATMVSTDGHRLTKYRAPFTGPKLAKGIIIPRKGMLEIRKVLERVDGEVELAVGGQHFFVRAGTLLLSVKLNNVTFPPYQQVIPSTHKRQVTALRDELIGVLRRAEVMAPEKTATVRVEVSSGSLKLTADNPDLGGAHQEIEIDYVGDPLVAGFNARYLIEALEVIDTPKVHLEFQNEFGPCVIRPVEGADFLGVVMSMRI